MMSYSVLFFSAPSPGQVFRYLERRRSDTSNVNNLLLSDPVGSKFMRCLFAEEQILEVIPTLDWMQSLARPLSEVFIPRVILLWRRNADSSGLLQWGFTVWENGVLVESSEYVFNVSSKQGLLSRLPGMRPKVSQRPDIAWALARDLPIDRVPAAGLRRHIPIIDYVTVAQLDQRSLLVENTPRLYRFPLNNS